MECKDFEGLLSAYLDRELKLEDQKEVGRHLEACGRCQAELQALLSVKERLRAQSLPSIPADLVAEIESQTVYRPRAWGDRRWWIPVLALAGAAAGWSLFEFHKPVVPGVPLTIPVAQAPQRPTALPQAVLAWHPTSDSDTDKDLQ